MPRGVGDEKWEFGLLSDDAWCNTACPVETICTLGHFKGIAVHIYIGIFYAEFLPVVFPYRRAVALGKVTGIFPDFIND